MIPKTRFFGTAGARGFTNIDITPEVGLRLGLAVSAYFKHQGSLLIAHEGRFGAQAISDAIRSGLIAGGMDVNDYGELPHPGFCWMIRDQNVLGGIYVTGSHMTPERIGIMIFLDDAAPATSSILLDIEKLLFSDYQAIPWNQIGKLIPNQKSGLKFYLKQLLTLKKDVIPIIKRENFQALVDPGHGTMREVLPQLLHHVGVETITLNTYSDPLFQGRHSDPSPENLVKSSQYVKQLDLDIAIATDSDGDRVSFITDSGESLIGDVIGALFAEQAFEEYGSGSIVTCVNASSLIEWVAERYEGDVIYNRIGPPDTVHHIKLNNPISAYEDVGKFYWPRTINNYWGDSGLATLELLNLLANKQKSLSETIRHFPKYKTIKTGVEVSDTIKYKVFKELLNNKDQIAEPNARILTIDGIRIFFSDGWLLIRPSGTEPFIRVYAESENPNRASELAQLGINQIIENKQKIEV